MIAIGLSNIGSACIALGRSEDAHARLSEAADVAREIGDRQTLAFCLNLLGALRRDEGNLDDARASMREGLAIRQQIGDRHGEAQSLLYLASTERRAGELAEAERFARQSLAIRRDIDHLMGVIQCLEEVGLVACERGDAEKGGSLIGAAKAARASSGIGTTEDDGTSPEAEARRALDDPAALAQGIEAGAALTVDEAVALALDGWDGGQDPEEPV